MPLANGNATESGFSPQEAEACRRLIELALAEDLNVDGDLTTTALVESSAHGQAAFVARSPGVLAGLPAVEQVFRIVDASLCFDRYQRDGDRVDAGTELAVVEGPLHSLLSSERLALNFLTHLSGIASLTHRFVTAVAGTGCRVYDTRKTLPGWRLLEKYAVRQGGGHNHRAGLYDAVLMKDNHLAFWRSSGRRDQPASIADAVRHARAAAPSAEFIEVEVDTLEQLRDALAGVPDAVLLDNMPPDDLCRAVSLRNDLAPGVVLEASGGITLENARAVSATGVDRISIGALTHSAPALDIGLDWKGA